MSYIDVTGKTEDEALRKGLEQLGMDRDDVSVSILERAKSGFLGIGATPACLRGGGAALLGGFFLLGLGLGLLVALGVGQLVVVVLALGILH